MGAPGGDSKLKARPTIAVCTARDVDRALDRGEVKLENLRIVVLDGVDRMLEFELDRQLARVLTSGKDPQGIFVADKITQEVDWLADWYLSDPVEVHRSEPRTAPAAPAKRPAFEDRPKRREDGRRGGGGGERSSRTGGRSAGKPAERTSDKPPPVNRLKANVFSDEPTTRIEKTLGSKFRTRRKRRI